MVQQVKFKTPEAAEYLGCQERTLIWWRSMGKGPSYVKVGGRVFYLQSQLDDFIQKGIVDPGAAA